MTDEAPRPDKPISPRATPLAVAVLWAAIFAIALTGYPKLLDNERRVGGYVLDAVQNGHWIMQRDVTGDIASKPPLLTWIASVSTLCFGHINRFSIYLPSALATLGVALLLLSAGRKYFGWRAGFIAAIAYLVSYVADAQVVTARYDGLFAFPVLLGALLAYRAWTTGRGWTAFWAAVTLATMVKGPLGLVLAASGLLAAFWERKSGNHVPLRGSHWLGIAIFLLVCGGWFALAYRDMGGALVSKLFGRELVGHVVHEGEVSPGQRFWEPSWNTWRDFLPWSIAGLAAFWRVLRKPASSVPERQFERFLFCWVLVSLFLFSIAAHQRGRLVWPLVPAIALLAGRELDRWLSGVSSRRLLLYAAAVSAVFLCGLLVYHHNLQKRSRDVQATLAMRSFAGRVKQVGAHFPLTYASDAPFALQFYLNTARPNVSFGRAAELLRGPAAAFVVAQNTDMLAELVGTNVQLHTLFEWNKVRHIAVVANRPTLEWDVDNACLIGPLRVTLHEARLDNSTVRDFTLSAKGTAAEVGFANMSPDTAVPVRVRWRESQPFAARTLQPGESWRVGPN